MPRFAVLVHIRGPLLDGLDGGVYDGAWTHRFVTAASEEEARVRTPEVLREEARFRQFQIESGDELPRLEVEEVRVASLFEGRGRTPGYVFYKENADNS